MKIFVSKNTGYDIRYLNGLIIYDFYSLYELIAEDVKNRKNKRGSGD